MSARKIAAETLYPDLFRDRNVVLFEDEAVQRQLFPLSVLRPSWEIRSGMGCLREWVQELAGHNRVILRSRAQLNAISAQLAGQNSSNFEEVRETVFLNGRLLGFWPTGHVSQVKIPQIIIAEGGIALIALRSAKQTSELLRLPGTELNSAIVQEVGDTPTEVIGWTIKYAHYVWHYMTHTPLLLQRQLEVGQEVGELLGAQALRESAIEGRIIGDAPVYVGKESRIWPQVIFSTEDGPIWIGDSVEIEPHCFLKGPLCIGNFGRIKAGTRLYGGSSFGPHCRVAGEISQSVLQGYANKQHEGFIGNSLLGEWVNLGADTVSSNLRNDYGGVRVKVDGKLVESGEQYLGSMIGDHAKTGINTMLNTGSVIGVGCNVYGGGFPPRYVRSFQWGGADGFRMMPLERTLEAARTAMSRRGRELSEAETVLLQRHYSEITAGVED